MWAVRKWMVTANLLADGAVVYLRADRTWASSADDARAEAERLPIDAEVEWAKTQGLAILDPYAIEVETGVGGVRHLSARERIRAEGPRAVLARFGY